MNGVTVIDIIEIYELSGWQILLTVVPIILLSFIGLIVTIKLVNIDKDKPFIPCIFILIGLIISLSLGLFMKNKCPARYIETNFEIAIEDSASFNEIHDKYEIIEEKENTWIVKEKK